MDFDVWVGSLKIFDRIIQPANPGPKLESDLAIFYFELAIVRLLVLGSGRGGGRKERCCQQCKRRRDADGHLGTFGSSRTQFAVAKDEGKNIGGRNHKLDSWRIQARTEKTAQRPFAFSWGF